MQLSSIANTTICGNTRERDNNLIELLRTAKAYGLTSNENNSAIGVSQISLMEYEICRISSGPDPGHLQLL